MPVDCGALCHQIMESELFGHVRGAFTGALSDKPGLVESAEGGTLFLDEIGNLDLSPQQKLLRFLECGEYRSLGGVQMRRANVRVIAATNRNLRKEVQEARFREDLFYRLNHFHVSLPPLRNRKSDIPLLIDHFLEKICDRYQQPKPQIDQAAMDTLVAHPWPGNIRELAHAVEHMFLLADDLHLRAQDLPEEIRKSASDSDSKPPSVHQYREARKGALEAFNAAFLSGALRRTLGNVTSAARQSGLRRQSFQELMKRHNIRSKDYRPTPPPI